MEQTPLAAIEDVMMQDEERFAGLLGRAAVSVWGDMPRDIQEALFETAMKGRDTDREALPGCCTQGIRARCIRRSPDGLRALELANATQLPMACD